MIGDVIGKPGRVALKKLLPDLRQELDLDMVIANGENSAGGFGITPETAQEMLSAGVHLVTTGNHVWDKKEIIPQLDEGMPVIRPANYPPAAPGQGYMILGDVMVMNLMGRVFLANLDCPFRTADAILEDVDRMSSPPRVILVDMHAEATSEKQAMGWYLDGRVSAVVGTHTHVPTADTRVLPKGTGFVTDLGMTGPHDSIIGSTIENVIEKFLTGMPNRGSVPSGGPVMMNAVLIDVDSQTGKANAIERIDRMVD